MGARHTDALVRAIGRIVEAMQPEAIYLFGSHARGDAGPDSDYDLLVIVP
jgi:predicted nucleotidyltransferase